MTRHRLVAVVTLAGALALLPLPASGQNEQPPISPPGFPPPPPDLPPFPPLPDDLKPCAEGTLPTPEAPCLPGGMPGPGMPGPGAGPADTGGPPPLKGGFLSRVWRFNADSDSYDAEADVLNVTITKVLNLPKRFADQDDPFVDSDAYVIFSPTTRVYRADGDRVPRETRYDTLLDGSDTVRVVGKVVPPAKWREDEDGMPTPTLRAKRVNVTG